ncbi:MAG: hypothetical protein C0168_10045 [Candidatus Aminicenantes bacterium]|nr:MAG: hypothetical protein C0168_10045 [Candidatus Aminicenantes bacterium]
MIWDKQAAKGSNCSGKAQKRLNIGSGGGRMSTWVTLNGQRRGQKWAIGVLAQSAPGSIQSECRGECRVAAFIALDSLG